MTNVTIDVKEIIIHRSFDYSDNKFYNSIELVPVEKKEGRISVSDVLGNAKEYCKERFPGVPYRTVDHTK